MFSTMLHDVSTLLQIQLLPYYFVPQRISRAEDDDTDPRMLACLADDDNITVRAFVAANPNTNIETLQILACDENDLVVEQAAANPLTPPSLLKLLAGQLERDKQIRIAVAGNPSTPVNVLEKLYTENDNNIDFLTSFASNPNLPEHLYTDLAETDDRRIHAKLITNPNIPPEILLKTAGKMIDTGYNRKEMQQITGNNPNLPEWVKTMIELL